MANDNNLHIEVSANVASLKTGLKQAENSVKGFEAEANKVTNATNNLGKSVQANAVPALTSFSQVIQDAPYGIRGVANNITQLTSQFGYLSKSTGGAGNALKAMISSLAGPAGILFAVSAVTSLLVTYGDEIANIGNETGKLVKKNEDLVKSLDSISDIYTSQISALDSQIKLLEAQKLPVGDLLKDKLKILKADLASTVSQRAALFTQIESLKAVSSQLSLWQKLANVAAKTRGIPTPFPKGFIDNEEQIKINELEANLSNLDKTIADLSLSILKIEKPEFFKKAKPKEDVEENVTMPLVTALKGSKAIVNKEAEGFLEISALGKIKGQLSTFRNELEPLVNSVSGTLVNVIPKADLMNERTSAWLLALQDFSGKANELIQGSLTNTFASLGDAIGNAMAQGTNIFTAAGKAILMGVGNFLSDLGKMMIKYGVAALAYSDASKGLLTPLTAGPSAGALIAAGTALSIIGGAIKSKVSGGNSYSGSGTDYSSSGTSTNYGSSTSYASSSGTSGGTYVFEIAGTKLIGVLKNTLDRNKSLGGSNLIFTP